MGLAHAFDSGARGDDAAAGDVRDAFFFQAVGRGNQTVARGQHRVEEEHVRVACARRHAEIVADRLERFLVAEHADVADGGRREHAQDAIGHGQPSPQHRHKHERTCGTRTLGLGQRGLDFLRRDLEMAQRLVGDKLREFLQQPAEVRRRRVLVAQGGYLEVGQRVPHEMEAGKGFGGHRCAQHGGGWPVESMHTGARRTRGG